MKFTINKILLSLCIVSLSSAIYAKNSDTVLPIATAGYAGDGAVSLDNGATWQTITIDPQHGQQFNDMTWANNQFVSVGSGFETSQTYATIFTSPDGVNWTSRVNQQQMGGSFNKIVYVNNLYFTFGTNYLSISSDGVKWQSIYLPQPVEPFLNEVDINSVAWADSRYAMVGASYGSSNAKKNKLVKNLKDSSTFYFTALSLDGINWTIVQQPTELFNIISINNQFIAEEYSNGGTAIVTSPDGITWTATTQYTPWTWYVNNTFFNVTQNSLMRSLDGKTWTTQSLPVSSGFRVKKIIYKNNQFLLSGNDPSVGGEVLSSPDGMTWTVMMTNPQNTVDAMG